MRIELFANEQRTIREKKNRREQRNPPNSVSALVDARNSLKNSTPAKMATQATRQIVAEDLASGLTPAKDNFE